MWIVKLLLNVDGGRVFNSQTTMITKLHKADNPELFTRTKLEDFEWKLVCWENIFLKLLIKTYDRQKWLSYPAGLVAHNCLWALTMIYQPLMLPQIRMTIELGAKLTAHNYSWFHICYKYSTDHLDSVLYNTKEIPPLFMTL